MRNDESLSVFPSVISLTTLYLIIFLAFCHTEPHGLCPLGFDAETRYQLK